MDLCTGFGCMQERPCSELGIEDPESETEV